MTPDNYTVQLPAGFNPFQCSGMWGFGHHCISNHGHLNRCKCACGQEQPLMDQCPTTNPNWSAGMAH